jgi:Peptidase family M28
VINWRLYRAAFAPFLIALAVAAFSLQGRPPALSTTLAPEAFEGERALAELKSLASAYPDRRPGSAGDEALARRVARTLEGLGGTAQGGFQVRTLRSRGQTIEGERSLTTVIAQRAGATDAPAILIVAHRDAAGAGAQAQLSGTAALLELARVFAARDTQRTIVLASTSGGSGGDAGAAQLASAATAALNAGGREPFDAAIVLGDLAGARTSRPMVLPFSDGVGSAPLQLQRTVAGAIAAETGVQPGAPSTLGQLAHLAFPLAVGEQGVLDEQGVPAVLVQVSGERGPSADDPVSAERLQGFGRAVLNAVDALDTAPDVPAAMESSLPIQRKTMPAWALRLLAIALLAPAVAAAVDGLARARRRRLPVGRWTLWTLSCALPFLCCALFAYLLGLLGILGADPPVPALPGALPLGATGATALVAMLLTFALAWLLWAALVRRLGWGARPDARVAGLASALVASAIAVVVWAGNPFAGLLVLPALHLWLLLASPERVQTGTRSGRAGALALVALGLAPLALLVAFYAHELGLGVGDVAWTALLLVAGGHVALGGALLWSLALGCAAAAAIVASSRRPAAGEPRAGDGVEIAIRGPMSYAGPGSLGGTESALRR